MTSKNKCIEISIPSSSEYVGVVRLAISGVASRCNFTVDEIEDLKIAVNEACTNAVVHAYNGKTGTVTVRCYPKHNELAVEVADQGAGFNVKEVLARAGKSTPSGKRPSLGLGLTFIQNLMDSTKIQSAPRKGTTIRFTKKHR